VCLVRAGRRSSAGEEWRKGNAEQMRGKKERRESVLCKRIKADRVPIILFSSLLSPRVM